MPNNFNSDIGPIVDEVTGPIDIAPFWALNSSQVTIENDKM